MPSLLVHLRTILVDAVSTVSRTVWGMAPGNARENAVRPMSSDFEAIESEKKDKERGTGFEHAFARRGIHSEPSWAGAGASVRDNLQQHLRDG